MSITLDGNGNSVPPEKSAKAVPVEVPRSEFLLHCLRMCKAVNLDKETVCVEVPLSLWRDIRRSGKNPSE